MSEPEDHEINVAAFDEYRPLLEDHLEKLIPALDKNNVSLNPVLELRSSELVQIAIGIGGAVGVEIVKQLFTIVRDIIKDSHHGKNRKPVRASFRHGDKQRVIETGDEDF